MVKVTSSQIKRARLRAGESQQEFAKHFGVARTTLLNWEKHPPPTTGTSAAHIERVLADLAVKRGQSAE
jgi:DNA-binding XRE family transcriptional regulator